MANFIQKFYLLKDVIDIDTLSDCEKILLLNGQIVGMETHSRKTYDKSIAELLEFSYSELNILLEKVKNVTQSSIKDYINPGLALVFLLNSIKIDLLSILGLWITARNERKKKFKTKSAACSKSNKKGLELNCRTE